MKKLMFVAAAIAAGVAVADVTSANVVGYLNKTDAVQKYNFVTAPFRAINGSAAEFNIQDIQVDASVTTGGAQLYILNADRKVDTTFQEKAHAWVRKADFTKYGITGFDDKNGVWAIQGGTLKAPTYTVPTLEKSVFSAGTGIQVYFTLANKSFTFAGSVSDAQLAIPAVQKYNFIGNCFPADCDIRDIQMDETVTTGGAQFYRLNADRKLDTTIQEKAYAWVKKSDFAKYGIVGREGDFGTWAIQGGTLKAPTYTVPTTAEELTIKAGSAVQVYVTLANKTIYVNPTYTLAK